MAYYELAMIDRERAEHSIGKSASYATLARTEPPSLQPVVKVANLAPIGFRNILPEPYWCLQMG